MSIIIKIRGFEEEFSETEKKIADYIINNMSTIINMTSSELSKEINVGQSSVIKFIKKIKIKGYSQFKLELKEDLIKDKSKEKYLYNDITLNDSLESISKKLTLGNVESLEETLENINFKNLERIISLLQKSNKIVILGVGASALVGKDFSHKLSKIGKLVLHDYDSHVQLTHVVNVSENDLVIAISHSGETKEVILGVETAIKNKATCVSLTKLSDNTISKLTDINLYSLAHESLLRSSAMTSRIAQLLLLDILFIGLTQLEFESSKKSIDESRSIIDKLK